MLPGRRAMDSPAGGTMNSDPTITLSPLPLETRGPRPAVGRGLGIVMLMTAAVLWSVSGVAVRVAGMDPIAFAFFRSLAAALAMLPLIPLGRGNRPRAWPMAASVVLSATVYALLILSMSVSTSGTGILLQYTGPIFCALFAWLAQGRTIGRQTAVAMSVAFAGIAVMIWGGWQPENWVGPVAGLVSGVAFGALILVLDYNDRAAGGVNPFLVVMLNNAGTALILLPLCLLAGTLLNVTPRQLLIVGLTGVIQLAIPYVLFQLALRRVRPVDASLLILLEPVLNPVWVGLATGEVPPWSTLVGGAAILAAMVIEAVKIEREGTTVMEQDERSTSDVQRPTSK